MTAQHNIDLLHYIRPRRQRSIGARPMMPQQRSLQQLMLLFLFWVAARGLKLTAICQSLQRHTHKGFSSYV